MADIKASEVANAIANAPGDAVAVAINLGEPVGSPWRVDYLLNYDTAANYANYERECVVLAVAPVNGLTAAQFQDRLNYCAEVAADGFGSHVMVSG